MRVALDRLTWPPIVAKFLLWRRLLLRGDWPGSRRKLASDRYYISPRSGEATRRYIQPFSSAVSIDIRATIIVFWWKHLTVADRFDFFVAADRDYEKSAGFRNVTLSSFFNCSISISPRRAITSLKSLRLKLAMRNFLSNVWEISDYLVI